VTRILVASSQPLVHLGVESLLRDSEFEIVARAHDGVAVADAMILSRPDTLVLSANLPRRSAIEVVRLIRSRGDDRRVVLLVGALSDRQIMEAFDLKIQGIVPEDGQHSLLLSCLKEVALGGQWIERSILQRAFGLARAPDGKPAKYAALTLRERAIADLVARGLRNREIGVQLGIMEGTVKLNLHRVFAKLEIDNRVELAMLIRDGSPPS
jgi:two-component system, NarL family, nitrate/nitrite response regulator NarL